MIKSVKFDMAFFYSPNLFTVLAFFLCINMESSANNQTLPDEEDPLIQSPFAEVSSTASFEYTFTRALIQLDHYANEMHTILMACDSMVTEPSRQQRLIMRHKEVYKAYETVRASTYNNVFIFDHPGEESLTTVSLSLPSAATYFENQTKPENVINYNITSNAYRFFELRSLQSEVENVWPEIMTEKATEIMAILSTPLYASCQMECTEHENTTRQETLLSMQRLLNTRQTVYDIIDVLRNERTFKRLALFEAAPLFRSEDLGISAGDLREQLALRDVIRPLFQSLLLSGPEI